MTCGKSEDLKHSCDKPGGPCATEMWVKGDHALNTCMQGAEQVTRRLIKERRRKESGRGLTAGST